MCFAYRARARINLIGWTGIALVQPETKGRAVSKGHELRTPFYGPDGKTRDNRVIHLPSAAISQLRKMHLLEKRGKPRLKHIVWSMLLEACDASLSGLQYMLGENLEGPVWCDCKCPKCRGIEGGESGGKRAV